MIKKSGGKAILSKSTFIRGLQCEKSLYLHKNRPFLRDPLPAWQLAKFSRGTKVGKVARCMYPGGLDASPKTHFQMAQAAENTAKWVAQGVEVIYEAVFIFEQVAVALDILLKTPEGYKAIEVKSSLAISDTYVWDAALQYYVISGNGLLLEDFSLVYVNRDYIRNGDLEYHKLFLNQSVLAQVKAMLPVVASKVVRFKEVVQLSGSPDIGIGNHCLEPYPCDFKGHCWKSVKKFSVFDLFDLDFSKSLRLYQGGSPNALDVPVEQLESRNSQLHQQSIAQNRIIKDPLQMAGFLQKAVGKIALLTCFSIKPPLPIYDGTRPYGDIPVIFGILELNNGVEKAEWFGPEMVAGEYSLLQFLNRAASLDNFIVFGKSEVIRNAISFLRLQLPEILPYLTIPDIVDLQEAFCGGGIYWPQMGNERTMSQILADFNQSFVETDDAGVYKKQEIILEMVSENKTPSIDSKIVDSIISAGRGEMGNLKIIWELLQNLSKTE